MYAEVQRENTRAGLDTPLLICHSPGVPNHTHILRIGNAVLTVKVRELPERITAQVFFDHWERNKATVAVLFLSHIAVDYRPACGNSRPFCVHESNGKQLMIL